MSKDKIKHCEDLLAGVAKLVAERRQTHGEQEVVFNEIADRWSSILGVEVTPEKVCLAMIELKIVRQVFGGGASDNFEDIIGYAAIAHSFIK